MMHAPGEETCEEPGWFKRETRAAINAALPAGWVERPASRRAAQRPEPQSRLEAGDVAVLRRLQPLLRRNLRRLR